jgi:hypothetical protein
VQQAMIGTGRPGINVTLFDQNRLNAAQRKITSESGARCAAADNQDLSFKFSHC